MSISAAASLLSAYDPTNPTSIDSALTTSGLADSYYSQGLNGTAQNDPGTESPVAAAPAAPTAPSAASQTPNIYQQALASLKQWSDTTLITSALGGGTTGAPDDSSSVASSLEAAAEAQQSGWNAQQQSALTAAQSALDAGTNVDTSA